jgi:hypothetical protein
MLLISVVRIIEVSVTPAQGGANALSAFRGSTRGSIEDAGKAVKYFSGADPAVEDGGDPTVSAGGKRGR